MAAGGGNDVWDQTLIKIFLFLIENFIWVFNCLPIGLWISTFQKQGFLKETEMLIETSFSSGSTMTFTMLKHHAAKVLLMSVTSQIYSLILPIMFE